ncbi:10137_t:CDS:2 [Paraglomus occultum]|uniref:10137_t:CDS:1 n=1 Tax=Paraglomus occultum TaxID=144539 RepID=A0A9N9CU45_9GLOM|nr:10137_t:CDS:2 [Paraglomus occultum]
MTIKKVNKDIKKLEKVIKEIETDPDLGTTNSTIYLENFSTTFKFQTAVQDGHIIWEDTSFLSKLRQEASTVQNQIARVAHNVDPAMLLLQQPGEGEKQVQQPVAYFILKQIAEICDLRVILDRQEGGNAGQIYADLHTYDEQFHSEISARLKTKASLPYSLTYAHEVKKDLAEKAMECAIQNYNYAKQFFGLAGLSHTMPVNNHVCYYSFGTDALQWWICEGCVVNNRNVQIKISPMYRWNFETAELLTGALHYQKRHSNSLQFRAAATSPFDMFPPPPFKMPVLTVHNEVSVTINKRIGIGHSYIVFLGSFADSTCVVKVERQEGVAKQEAGVLKHLIGVRGLPTVQLVGHEQISGHGVIIIEPFGETYAQHYYQNKNWRDVVDTRNVQQVGALLLDTLAKVHQLGIVHNDISPMNCISASCFNYGGDSAIDLTYEIINEKPVDVILIDWASATPAFASEEQPGTVTGTAAFMNEVLILMVLAEGMMKIERTPVDDLVSLAYTLLWMRRGGNLPWEKYGCGVNEAADRLNLLHEAMINLPDNDGIGSFVSWARSLNRMATVDEIKYNEGKNKLLMIESSSTTATHAMNYA